jgi:hypothetical protein
MGAAQIPERLSPGKLLQSMLAIIATDGTPMQGIPLSGCSMNEVSRRRMPRLARYASAPQAGA